MRLLGVLTALTCLAGCTASWQAPIENGGVPPAVRTPIPAEATAYRVRRGDTLVSIAWRANLDWRKLAAWNNLTDPHRILPGQMLRLRPPPVKRASGAPKPPPRQVGSVEQSAGAKSHRSEHPSPQKQTAATKKKSNAQPTNPRLAWVWPTNGAVTVGYSASDPSREGIKIAGSLGQPVRAAERGSVVYSGSGLIGYGQLIIIKHNDKYLSAYGNNRKILVKEGDQVTKGEQIAEMGQGGGGSALLHFEIRREGEPVNPQALLPKRHR